MRIQPLFLFSNPAFSRKNLQKPWFLSCLLNKKASICCGLVSCNSYRCSLLYHLGVQSSIDNEPPFLRRLPLCLKSRYFFTINRLLFIDSYPQISNLTVAITMFWILLSLFSLNYRLYFTNFCKIFTQKPAFINFFLVFTANFNSLQWKNNRYDFLPLSTFGIKNSFIQNKLGV